MIITYINLLIVNVLFLLAAFLEGQAHEPRMPFEPFAIGISFLFGLGLGTHRALKLSRSHNFPEPEFFDRYLIKVHRGLIPDALVIGFLLFLVIALAHKGIIGLPLTTAGVIVDFYLTMLFGFGAMLYHTKRTRL
jgi:hypothetical protein